MIWCIHSFYKLSINDFDFLAKNTASELPDVMLSPKNSRWWPFWKTFEQFCTQISGNSDDLSKRQPETESIAIDSKLTENGQLSVKRCAL